MCSTFCPNYKSIESKPIVVRVGHAKQEFFVHEKLLRASSEFFDMALKKEWKEGQEAAVDSSDAKPEYFRVWVKFLYIGRVYMREEKADNKSEKKRFKGAYSLHSKRTEASSTTGLDYL
jgi:hypothetical protein